MSNPHADVDDADRLARVKLSSAIEPGDLRVTGLLSELGAVKVLDYLEDAGEVENHWGFTIATSSPTSIPARSSSRPPIGASGSSSPAMPSGPTSSRAGVAPAHCTIEAANPSGCGSGERLTSTSSRPTPWPWWARGPRQATAHTRRRS